MTNFEAISAESEHFFIAQVYHSSAPLGKEARNALAVLKEMEEELNLTNASRNIMARTCSSLIVSRQTAATSVPIHIMTFV